MKRKIEILAGSILVGLVVVWVGQRLLILAINRGKTGGRVLTIGAYMRDYIEKHGDFPSSENALIEGVLAAREAVGMKDSEAYERHMRDMLRGFSIRYGISLDDISELGGKLYKKGTAEQLLLIDGPFHESLKSRYESISMFCYRVMLEAGSRSVNRDANEAQMNSSEERVSAGQRRGE